MDVSVRVARSNGLVNFSFFFLMIAQLAWFLRVSQVEDWQESIFIVRIFSVSPDCGPDIDIDACVGLDCISEADTSSLHTNVLIHSRHGRLACDIVKCLILVSKGYLTWLLEVECRLQGLLLERWYKCHIWLSIHYICFLCEGWLFVSLDVSPVICSISGRARVKCCEAPAGHFGILRWWLLSIVWLRLLRYGTMAKTSRVKTTLLLQTHACLRHAQLSLTIAIWARSLFFPCAFLLVYIIWVISESSSEDLLYFSDLSDAFLLVIHKLVVTFDHVNKLVYITAWDHDIANFLFWLHLLLHHERIGELLGHYPAVQGYRWILGDGSTQHFCEFE